MSGHHRVIKIVILGAEKTGKTALVQKYIHALFTEEYDPSFAGTDQKQISLNGRTYVLDIIPAEPAGEHVLCQTGDAFILLYAINNRKSFQHIHQLHNQISLAKGGSLSKFPLFLVGSKADLDSERRVTLEEGRQLAIQLRCHKLFEVSSKTQVAEINDMFEKLAREIIQPERSSMPSPPSKPPATPIGPTSRPPLTPISQSEGATSTLSNSSKRSSVLDRFKFGSLKRKGSFQSLTRKKSGSFGESVLSLNSTRPSKDNMRSVSYGNTLTSTPSRTSNLSSPYILDVDTSSWGETIKWPTEIIPEEESRTR